MLEKLVSLYPTAKIMVHGESMGGMVACSLASKYPLHVSLAYVDRTFSDLPSAGSSLLKMNFVTGDENQKGTDGKDVRRETER